MRDLQIKKEVFPKEDTSSLGETDIKEYFFLFFSSFFGFPIGPETLRRRGGAVLLSFKYQLRCFYCFLLVGVAAFFFFSRKQIGSVYLECFIQM